MKTRLLSIISLLVLLVTTTCSQVDANYSLPISYYQMSMPSVTYNFVSNKLAVETKSAVLLGTNTNPMTGGPDGPGIGYFDPTQVWSLLNSTAFSRTLGWNDPGYDYMLPPETSPSSVLYRIHVNYGPGASIWIECTGKSPGVDTYLAVGFWGVNALGTQDASGVPVVDQSLFPSPYSGIFGTNSSSTKWRWDGLMDHNTYIVPFSYLNAPNQLFSANYRLYIGDATGNELLVDKNGNPVSSAATTTTWHWQGPAFVFISKTDVSASAVVESEVYTVSGIVTPGTSSISITDGEYSSSTNNGATWSSWTSAPGTIANTNKVKVRQTAASGHGVTTTATLAIPGVPGPGTFRVTTTTVPDPTWPVKIKDAFDQPSLAYAYSIAPDMVEPNNAVIMIKDGILPNETSFSTDRNITVTLRGGYNTGFSSSNGVTVIQGSSNVLTVKQGKIIVDKISLRSTSAL
jgi:hypothetical protein